MDSYPGGHILYGYVSDDTVEEEIAVERASTSGKYLVPTHEVSNLSFHVAVLGKAPLVPLAKTSGEELLQCDSSQVNIAIAITDGDNLQVPILQYPQSTYWNTQEHENGTRGPVGRLSVLTNQSIHIKAEEIGSLRP